MECVSQYKANAHAHHSSTDVIVEFISVLLCRLLLDNLRRNCPSPVTGEEEEKLFSDLLPKYLRPKAQNPDQRGAIDFDSMALHWNELVGDGNVGPAVKYKTVSQLEAFWDQGKRKRNKVCTMFPFRAEDSRACGALRHDWSKPSSSFGELHAPHPSTTAVETVPLQEVRMASYIEIYTCMRCGSVRIAWF